MTVKRAPRLAPDEHIAPYLTRRGRFVGLDPLEGRRLPSVLKVLAAAGWAAMTGYAFWRAWKDTRPVADVGDIADVGDVDDERR